MYTETKEPWLLERYARKHGGKYRHQIDAARGSLYRGVREHLKATQQEMADYLGLTLRGYQYRERMKVVMYPLEIAVLHDLSGMDADTFMKMLYSIA